MAEKLDPQQVVTFEELLRAMMFETEATRRVLVRKGLLTNEEVLEEIRTVQRAMDSRAKVMARQQPFCRSSRVTTPTRIIWGSSRISRSSTRSSSVARPWANRLSCPSGAVFSPTNRFRTSLSTSEACPVRVSNYLS